MSRATDAGTDDASARIRAAADRLERALESGEPDGSDGDPSKTAAELRDVVEEADRLLETVDLDSLPDAVDFEELPNAVDLESVPEALETRDPSAALDPSGIRHAIRLRELWNSVDLVEFARSKARLGDELADVGVGGEGGGEDRGGQNEGEDEDEPAEAGDSEAAAEIRRFAEEIRPAATNAAVQQQAQKAVREARTGVIAAHATLEELYEANGTRRRPASRNPTAVSLVPAGPVPDGVSTRFSSVPSNVRRAKIDALPRIYGRRWRSVGRRGR